MNMVEKVARALEPNAWAALDGQDNLAHNHMRIASMQMARAAIEAMEPTGFIEEAGWQRIKPMLSEDWLSLDQVGEVFKAMIQAALKEGQE